MDASQDGQSLPPAGWFVDAQNPAQERWWDGTKWTEHRRNREVTPAPQTYSPPAAQPQPYASNAYPGQQPYAAPRPTGLSPRGRTALTVGIVAVGLFVLGFLLMILGGSTAQLNFLLWLGLLVFSGAVVCGIIAVILAIVAAVRHT
ncbi:DUF2510 domain-containing protein [Leifsonia sp. NPDC058248]|uniref:DUF2510 domain-containing protein n=1 Tax=Leifsonia sp. NPDC058248 TaxID=3346402 RepID=UPI0036DA6FFF